MLLKSEDTIVQGKCDSVIDCISGCFQFGGGERKIQFNFTLPFVIV
jgi:hypothetical protein